MQLGFGPPASGALHRWSCVEESAERIPLVSFDVPGARIGAELVADLLSMGTLAAADSAEVDHMCKRFAGFSEYAGRHAVPC